MQFVEIVYFNIKMFYSHTPKLTFFRRSPWRTSRCLPRTTTISRSWRSGAHSKVQCYAFISQASFLCFRLQVTEAR